MLLKLSYSVKILTVFFVLQLSKKYYVHSFPKCYGKELKYDVDICKYLIPNSEGMMGKSNKSFPYITSIRSESPRSGYKELIIWSTFKSKTEKGEMKEYFDYETRDDNKTIVFPIWDLLAVIYPSVEGPEFSFHNGNLETYCCNDTRFFYHGTIVRLRKDLREAKGTYSLNPFNTKHGSNKTEHYVGQIRASVPIIKVFKETNLRTAIFGSSNNYWITDHIILPLI